MSRDGKHIPTRPGFHRQLTTLRDALPSGIMGNTARKALGGELKDTIFDAATLWDRAYGSTTMILHVEGTTIPNTPSDPQHLRASVYLPPRFVQAHQATHPAIARIVQLFIEELGVATVQQWKADAQHQGWSMTQGGYGAAHNPHTSVLVPNPEPNSSHYNFYGRPPGVLDNLLHTAPAPPAPPAPAPAVVVIEDDDDDDEQFDDATINIMDALERAAYAESRVQELERQVDHLEAQLAAAERRTTRLQDQVQSRGMFSSGTPAPGTPPRSQAALRAQLPRTPVRSMTPSRSEPIASSSRAPPPYSPSHARSPLAATASNDSHFPRHLVPRLNNFVRDNGLEEFAISISMALTQNHAAKWYEELCALGIDAGAVSVLLADLAAV
ncbi:hypothetical protein R3P38DRAFT_2503193 [Favolaschia claudopus]|uniref:Uncharacterized protein n=1 Tax=Favolaschia claudopus TaxID=2862362 RepID=A0AAW0DNW0_9AGAR